MSVALAVRFMRDEDALRNTRDIIIISFFFILFVHYIFVMYDGPFCQGRAAIKISLLYILINIDSMACLK